MSELDPKTKALNADVRFRLSTLDVDKFVGEIIDDKFDPTNNLVVVRGSQLNVLKELQAKFDYDIYVIAHCVLVPNVIRATEGYRDNVPLAAHKSKKWYDKEAWFAKNIEIIMTSRTADDNLTFAETSSSQ